MFNEISTQHRVPNARGTRSPRTRSPSARRSTVPPDARLSKGSHQIDTNNAVQTSSQDRGRPECVHRQKGDTSRESSLSRVGRDHRAVSEVRPRDTSYIRFDPNSPNLRKRFSRNSTELLHTAINQNHQFKTALTRSMSAQSISSQHDTDRKKNIPMVHEHFLQGSQLQQQQQQQQISHPSRPPAVLWNSFNIAGQNPESDAEDKNSKDSGAKPNFLVKASISPLTVLKDEYDTKRPSTNVSVSISGLSNTDNSFQNLVESGSSKVSDNTSATLANSQADSNSNINTSSRIYSRMSQIINIAHNSMHSLVPMLSLKEDEAGEESVAAETIHSGNISNFQSESDESDNEYDPEFHNSDVPYNIDSVKSPSVLVNSVNSQNGTGSPSQDFTEIINEINDFQSNFVDRFNSNTPTSAITQKLNRTQQKILDYKELHALESPTTVPSFSGKPTEYEISNSYNLKIQHETILSQYTSIRLRFASKVSSNQDKVKKQMRTHTGVLGFVNRVHFLNELEPNESSWYHRCNSTSSDEEHSITFDNKDAFLKKMWNDEVENLFHNAKHDQSHELGSRTAEENHSEDSTYYNEMSKTINISDLAKNVRLN
ncbi:hypothetical protein PICST_28730 [Scheffersomyces stipitis CBS 6054]|uniref:Uncharacterized protein n=1 Tax=Scheffersomyces stipitis (strain ATCC 58785 / CBS 6054 / NBRC 10063 / NRRL Y-11545) TaxID=322104 RepID=A3GGT3_PICST|nr:predicted protein [Scheffersomyces stipitis CBS 6054]EAZ63975.2 hypothetical protein PICST_28730 [Scheffersomyces stipitis CBS 6054]KAG2735681.1 hypothetical protein G9P44_001895 [Scheffersomyces stipitis]